MTFYCLIGQEMLNFVTNCCKLLKVNQAAKREVSSTDNVILILLKLYKCFCQGQKICITFGYNLQINFL